MSHLPAILLEASIFNAAVIWLIRAALELSCKRNALVLADKHFAIYCQHGLRARDVPEIQQLLEQMQLSREIYKNVAIEYNRCIAKLAYLLVAKLLGFQPVSGHED